MHLACGMNCHHKCQKHVANLCGINQKAFSEALGQANVSAYLCQAFEYSNHT